MAIKVSRVTQPLFSDGGTLILPEWIADGTLKTHEIPQLDDLYGGGTVQLYPIGSQFRSVGHPGEIWRYSKAAAGLTRGRFHFNSFQCPGLGGNSVGSGFEGAFYEAITAGDTSFKIVDTAATLNLYEGAVLVVFNTAYFDIYRVIGNDASDGTSTTCYIGDPGFKAAVTTSIGITVYLNQYAGVTNALGSGWYTAVGSALRNVTSGYYFWMKTVGWVFPATNSTYCGQTAYQRDVHVHQDGSVEGATSTTYLYQKVGSIRYGTSNSYGDTMIWMQLDE